MSQISADPFLEGQRISMKSTIAVSRLPRAGVSVVCAVAAIVVLALSTPTTGAAEILLNAPTGSGSYYGMWTPYASEASFTLNGSYSITTISAVFRTPSGSTYTTFQLSLQDAVSNPLNVYASQDANAAVGTTSTLTLNVNRTLSAGTYYLAALVPGYFQSSPTAGNVDGWLLSNGAYNQLAGSIVNGVYVAANPVVFNTGGVYVAPAFTVYGSPVPEPSACAMVAAGAAALYGLRRRYPI